MKSAFVISASPTKFAAASYASDLRGQMEYLSRLGFDAVELHIRDPKEVDLPLIRQITNDNGLNVCAIGTGQSYVEDGLSLSHADPSIRRQCVQRLKDAVDFASELDALVIIGLMRGRTGRGIDQREALDLIAEGLDICLESAQMEPRLVIEPINRYETDLLNTIKDTLEFINEVGSPNLGILLDTFHMNIEEPSIEESIRLAGDKIMHVHTADSNRWAPGFGHVDFGSLIRTLKEVNYDGYLSAEVLPKPDINTAAEMTIKTLHRCFGISGLE